MNLLNENYEPMVVDSDECVTSKHIWYYSIDRKDFFLSDMFVWSSPVTNGYIIDIDGATTIVPEHFFVVMGDYDVGLDSIQFAEILGREFDVYTIKKDLEEDSWLLKSLKVVGYVENHLFYYPFFDNMFPIVVGDVVIIVSSKDMYNRIKRLSFSDFI